MAHDGAEGFYAVTLRRLTRLVASSYKGTREYVLHAMDGEMKKRHGQHTPRWRGAHRRFSKWIQPQGLQSAKIQQLRLSAMSVLLLPGPELPEIELKDDKYGKVKY